MSGNLVRNRMLFEVPTDLTYFVHNQDYLVVNPEAGARCVLSAPEFRVLEALTRALPDGQPVPLEGTAETERTLAKLILNWVVYFNGHRPVIKISEPPLSYVYLSLIHI